MRGPVPRGRSKMKRALNLILVALIAFLSGCASFVRHNIPVQVYVPKQIDSDQKAELTYSISVHNPSDLSDWKIAGAEISRGVREHLVASGYFTSVRESKDYSSFHINFEITMNPSPNEFALQFLSGLTWAIIPIWYTDDMELSATVYEGGRKSESFFEREDVTQVYWLPVIPVGIFKNYTTAKSDIIENYSHAILSQMEMKKLLPVRKHRVPPTIAENSTQEKMDIVDYDFNASTRNGFISVDVSKTGIGIREQVIKKIGHICSSSNISLAAGEEDLTEGGRYQILTEKVENNVLTITFRAVY